MPTHAHPVTVGRYELLRRVGRGGMATVYLARQIDLDRLVALKELNALQESDPSVAQRFLRESRLAGSLSHPNIVTVHDYFEYRGTPYIAMEFMPRGSLRPHVARMPLAEIGGVLDGMLAALAHAEQHSVVHRDLKPENVMVSSDGRVKITDFGIAKATNVVRLGASLTSTGTTLGTPSYMAPEQAMAGAIGPWTDLYSLGVMAFELISGQRPFDSAESPMAILMRQVNDPIPPLATIVPQLEPRLSDWVERLVVKDPERRTRSAAEAGDDLEEILIDMLGPRWRRASRLSELPGEPASLESLPLVTESGASLESADEMAATVPPASPPPPPPRAPRPRRARRPPRALPARARVPSIGVAALLLAALVGVGAFVASRVGNITPAADTPAAEGRAGGGGGGGGESVAVPPGWKAVQTPVGTPLPLSDAVTLAPGGQPGDGSVSVGEMEGDTAANTSLLPPDLLPSSGSLPPRSRVVLRDQGLQAWRYDDLRLPGGKDLTAFVIPTTTGVAAVACSPPATASDSFTNACESIASSLRLKGSRALEVGPSTAYANAISGVLGELQHGAREHAADLEAGGDRQRRAQAADSLAGLYDNAARRLESLEVSPADGAANTRLVAALDKTAGAYRDAGAAASAGDEAGYRSARDEVKGGERAIDGAIAALQAAGYAATPREPSDSSGSDGGGDAGSTAPDASDPIGGGDGQAAPDSSGGEDDPSGSSKSDDPSDDAEGGSDGA